MRLSVSYKVKITLAVVLVVLSVYATGISIVSLLSLILAGAIAPLSVVPLTFLLIAVAASEHILTAITGVTLANGPLVFLSTRAIPLFVLVSSVLNDAFLALDREPLYTVRRKLLRPGFYQHSMLGRSLTLSPYIATTKYGDSIGVWSFSPSHSSPYKTGVFVGDQFVACPTAMPYEAIELLESTVRVIYTMFNGMVSFRTIDTKPLLAPTAVYYGVVFKGRQILSFILLDNSVIIGRRIYESVYITTDDILKHIKMRDILQ